MELPSCLARYQRHCKKFSKCSWICLINFINILARFNFVDLTLIFQEFCWILLKNKIYKIRRIGINEFTMMYNLLLLVYINTLQKNQRDVFNMFLYVYIFIYIYVFIYTYIFI